MLAVSEFALLLVLDLIRGFFAARIALRPIRLCDRRRATLVVFVATVSDLCVVFDHTFRWDLRVFFVDDDLLTHN